MTCLVIPILYTVMACIIVRTDDIRTERVNEEIINQYTPYGENVFPRKLAASALREYMYLNVL